MHISVLSAPVTDKNNMIQGEDDGASLTKVVSKDDA